MRTVSREVQSVRQNGFNQDLSGREGRREGREAPSRAQMLVGAAEPEEARFLPTALVFLWEGGNKAAECGWEGCAGERRERRRHMPAAGSQAAA